MKYFSWNVNGIRAVLQKGFLDSVHKSNCDIICLQETKAHPEQVDLVLDTFPHHFWNAAEKKGYSGTAIFSKKKPLAVSYGLSKDCLSKNNLGEEQDNEGRVITLEFSSQYLITVYTPNARHGLVRLDFRQDWDKAFFDYVTTLEKKKPVVFCGDLNVAHTPLDLARPKQNVGNPGFTDEERAGFQAYIDHGFLDTFRLFEKEGGHYSWWSYRAGARKRNIGWRIDYFLVSASLKNQVQNAAILPGVLGSDHAPIVMEMK